MLIELLQGKEVGGDVTRKLKPDDRKARLKTLQGQHKQWKVNRNADPTILASILQQGEIEERDLDMVHIPTSYVRATVKNIQSQWSEVCAIITRVLTFLEFFKYFIDDKINVLRIFNIKIKI